MYSFYCLPRHVTRLFLSVVGGFALIAACTGDTSTPPGNAALTPTTQAGTPAATPTRTAVSAIASPSPVPPTLVPIVGSAGFWEGIFTSATPGMELSATTMIQVHPAVPVPSDVRLNAVDPGYYRFDGEPAGFGFFPRVVSLQNGDLVVVFKEGAHEPVPSGRTVAVRSEDRGATWSDPVVVFDMPNINDSPLGIVQQQDGRVLVGGWVVPSETAGTLYDGWDGFLVASDDGGRTWGPPKFLVNACRGWQPATVLSNGDVASLGLCDLGQGDERLGPQTVRAIFFSNSSRESETVSPDGLGGYDEWSIVETENPGELAAVFRHQ